MMEYFVWILNEGYRMFFRLGNDVISFLADWVLVWAPIVLVLFFIKELLEKNGKSTYFLSFGFIIDGLLLAGLLFLLFQL